MITYQKIAIWSHQQVTRYTQLSSLLFEMNCIPSGKLISNRNKNKTLSLATQKYEQRIKAAKNKPGMYINVSRDRNSNECSNESTANWIQKRTDIDNWRRDVISAMQQEMTDSYTSTNTYDSHLQPDSSTLTTTSTLLSAGEIYQRNFQRYQNQPPIAYDSNNKKVIKSPSIPLFQSKLLDHQLYPKYNQYAEKKNYVENNAIITDDDEVFIPINTGNICLNSISNESYKLPFVKNIQPFHNYPTNGTKIYPEERNLKYTVQSTENPWLLSTTQRNSGEKIFDRLHSPHKSSGIIMSQNFHQNLVSSSVSNGQRRCDKSHDHTGHPKINLHKNETNAKIILRNSNSSTNNEQSLNQFQRSGSLNIKRINVTNGIKIFNNNLNHPSIQIEKIQSKNFHHPLTTNAETRQLYEFGDNQGAFIRTPNPQSNNYQFVVLVPTYSQEDLASKALSNNCQRGLIVKNNSFSNLRDQKEYIPKVSINKPLKMRLEFASEPNLGRHSVNMKPMKIFS